MYTRLRLLRPLVIAEAHRCVTTSAASTATLAQTFASQLQAKFSEDMCRLCLLAVHEVLDELHGHLSSPHRTSPWHTLYCKPRSPFHTGVTSLADGLNVAFAAASILLAATLCPFLDLRLDVDPGKSSWNNAMGVFQFHKSHVTSAEKGIEAMERLRKCVEAKGRAAEGESAVL